MPKRSCGRRWQGTGHRRSSTPTRAASSRPMSLPRRCWAQAQSCRWTGAGVVYAIAAILDVSHHLAPLRVEVVQRLAPSVPGTTVVFSRSLGYVLRLKLGVYCPSDVERIANRSRRISNSVDQNGGGACHR